MTKIDYKNFIEDGLLRVEKIEFEQIARIIEKSHRRIKSAKTLIEDQDSEGGFQLAYESMLLSGRALVFSYGLRPRAAGSHKIVVDFCSLVLGDKYKTLTYKFDKMRKERNYLIYGTNLSLSKLEAENAIKIAEEFINRIKEFIQDKNPQKELI